MKAGLKVKAPLLVSPGSDKIDETIRRDGQMAELQAIGATVLANACGPCIGQWKREDAAAGKRNSIVNSYNRIFPRRNHGHAETQSFITSPEMAPATRRPQSPGTTSGAGRAGWSSATRTTATGAPASTRRWSRGTWAAAP